MLLSLTIRVIFYLFNCYLSCYTCKCGPIILSNEKYYIMIFSPKIWIGILVSLVSLNLNMINGLKNGC